MLIPVDQVARIGNARKDMFMQGPVFISPLLLREEV